MMRLPVRSALLTIAVLGATLPSCTASLELDRFRKSTGAFAEGTEIKYSDVKFVARAMHSHIGEYMEIRVVDKDDRLQAKAVYAGVTAPDMSFYMRGVLPKANAPYRLDFWADHNKSFKYDGIEGGINEKDHAWRRVLSDPLPEDVKRSGDRYELTFVHDTAFVDILTDLQGNKTSGEDTLLPFNLTITVGELVDKMIEVRVVDAASGRLVALHRRGRAPTTYTAQVTGVLDELTTYEVSVHVDTNADEKYTTADPSWRLELMSTSTGLDGALDLTTHPQSPITTGEP